MVKNPPDGVLLGLRGYGPAYSGTFVWELWHSNPINYALWDTLQGRIQGGGGGGVRPPLIWEKYWFFMQFFRLLPKISPNLGYVFTPRPSYFKVLDPPLPCIWEIHQAWYCPYCTSLYYSLAGLLYGCNTVLLIPQLSNVYIYGTFMYLTGWWSDTILMPCHWQGLAGWIKGPSHNCLVVFSVTRDGSYIFCREGSS
jgi:hypothetical protein